MQAKIYDLPEYAAMRAKFDKVQAEQVRVKELKAQSDAEATAPQKASAVARHRLLAERAALEEREGELNQEVEDARQELDIIRGRLSVDLVKPLRIKSLERVKENIKAIKTIIENNRVDRQDRAALRKR